MAKPRKPKNTEDTKPENSGAVVRHQKLCLSIDIHKRRVYGFTELEITVPDIGIVGLHAENLVIVGVSVDGDPTEFEYYPRHQHLESEKSFNTVSSPSSAADAAGSFYFSSIEKELVPNLLINCCKAFKNVIEQQEQPFSENGGEVSGEDKQNIRKVRIDYWVEKSEAGIQFSNDTAHTDNQIRRARCWFPCLDDGVQQCRYDLEFTVSLNLVAVSNGTLLYQVLSKDNPPRKTFVYQLDIPVNAQWISLAVGPFEILSDHQIGLISHMCLPVNSLKLKHAVEFFHGAFSCFKDYLSVDFPFGSYKQIFIEPEMAVSSACLGASTCVFSSHLLFDEKIIDQTIDTRIKLAYALARQWFGIYITPEAPNDEWLLDGLAGFLTDLFIKKNLGNNEARYQRYKATCAVCKADDGSVTTLSSSAACKDLYGTQRIGIYGKIRSWKSVAILQMLEKQMGPESFRKILQNIVSRAKDTTQASRSLSTKEFRHLANKIGNLERPFLKEFFPRWVESCGCPVLRMGFSYNKRKNMVEMAVLRECTVTPATGAENRDTDSGWPGMMSIRIYELDGVFDHPVLPMTGESWQLLEIQCHSKLAARRLQKTKKGSKPDGSDDNADISALDIRSSVESPLLWLRADPEMEYLAEIHFNQPVQMWINQLEKDKDVIAQAQAIATLETLPHLSFSVINALNNFLTDSKAFWRVRSDAAFTMAKMASEDTDWAAMLNLIKFFKSQRFDADTGLPKPNDFRDFPEYFVLEVYAYILKLSSFQYIPFSIVDSETLAIPHAVATVRTTDQKSPREAVEFVLQLLKYNDNNGNPYSDVFWLAALVQSVGELEFGQQNILFLASLLKRIDRLLQFDRLMPSYNGILTISCIRTLTQIALKLSGFLSLDRVFELVRPYQNFNSVWQVQIEASRALIDLEYHSKGIDAAILLFIKYLKEEKSLRGQVKLAVHVMRLCQLMSRYDSNDVVKSDTLVALLVLLEGHMAFNNVCLRHYLFCILQVLAGRPPTLHGVPKEYKTLHMGDTGTCSEQKKGLTTLIPEFNQPEPSLSAAPMPSVPAILTSERPDDPKLRPDNLGIPESSKEGGAFPEAPNQATAIVEAPREAASVSSSHERRMPVVKIKVRSSAATSRADADNQTTERSHAAPHETDHGASSSVSVDAPQRNFAEATSISNQNLEEVNSCHDRGSHMTASIGSAKLVSDGDEHAREFQCTADSRRVFGKFQPEDPSSSSIIHDNNVDADAQKYASLQTLSLPQHDHVMVSSHSPHHGKKEKKKDREKKRKRENHKEHRNDPEYIERKRLKKEKKQKEKEMTKLLNENIKPLPIAMPRAKEELVVKSTTGQLKPDEPSGSRSNVGINSKPEASEGTPAAPKLRIKFKNRTLNKS